MAGIESHDEIAEWMASLDTSEWDRTVVVIDRLAELGSMARMPFSETLGDGLFELRFTLGPTSRRITHRFTKDPADEAVLFAFDCGHCGTKRTYVSAYGPAMEPADMHMVTGCVITDVIGELTYAHRRVRASGRDHPSVARVADLVVATPRQIEPDSEVVEVSEQPVPVRLDDQVTHGVAVRRPRV